MKTIGFNPVKEKFVPVDSVVKLSAPLRLALSKVAGHLVPDFMKPIAAPSAKAAEVASCSGCAFQPIIHRRNSCEEVVCCRARNRRDSTEVTFIYCNEVGEPL